MLPHPYCTRRQAADYMVISTTSIDRLISRGKIRKQTMEHAEEDSDPEALAVRLYTDDVLAILPPPKTICDAGGQLPASSLARKRARVAPHLRRIAVVPALLLIIWGQVYIQTTEAAQSPAVVQRNPDGRDHQTVAGAFMVDAPALTLGLAFPPFSRTEARGIFCSPTIAERMDDFQPLNSGGLSHEPPALGMGRDNLLDRIELIESHGRAGVLGDNGLARGPYQIWRGAWSDSNRGRLKRGLLTIPYALAFDRETSRIVASRYLDILRGQFIRRLHRQPTEKELFAAWNLGFKGFADRHFDLNAVPETTKKALCKL